MSSDKLFHARIVAEKRVIKQVRISVNSLDVVWISKVVSSSLLYQRRNKLHGIIGSKSIQNLKENCQFVLASTALKRFPAYFENSFSTLQSLVVPVLILAASLWIDWSCCLFSAEQLSQTTSQYSSKGRIKLTYSCSNDFQLTLNFSVLMRFNRTQALVHLKFPELEVFFLLFCDVQGF